MTKRVTFTEEAADRIARAVHQSEATSPASHTPNRQYKLADRPWFRFPFYPAVLPKDGDAPGIRKVTVNNGYFGIGGRGPSNAGWFGQETTTVEVDITGDGFCIMQVSKAGPSDNPGYVYRATAPVWTSGVFWEFFIFKANKTGAGVVTLLDIDPGNKYVAANI